MCVLIETPFLYEFVYIRVYIKMICTAIRYSNTHCYKKEMYIPFHEMLPEMKEREKLLTISKCPTFFSVIIPLPKNMFNYFFQPLWHIPSGRYCVILMRRNCRKPSTNDTSPCTGRKQTNLITIGYIYVAQWPII